MFARKSRGGRHRALVGKSLGTRDRDNPIIGHRLPAGGIHIHALADPCELCDRIAGQVKS